MIGIKEQIEKVKYYETFNINDIKELLISLYEKEKTEEEITRNINSI